MSHSQRDDVPEGVVIVENEMEFTLERDDIDWRDDDIFDLPEGVQIHVVNQSEEEGRTDKFVRFPPGYVEPEHTHEAEHATLIIDGRMLVHGYELTSGDYIFGPSELPHGPMEYPDGCIVFSSSVGGSTVHDWD